MNTILPGKDLALYVETYKDEEPTPDQINLIKELHATCPVYVEMIYDHLEDELSTPINEIKEMFFLESVRLKKYGDLWVFILEPFGHVRGALDRFQYFTFENKTLTKWTEG